MVDQETVHFLETESEFFYSEIHGYTHWKTVERNGLYLAQFTGADRQVVSYFAHFHDCMRENENVDPEHGPRATRFLKLNRIRIRLDDDQFCKLCVACSGHTHGRKAKCPTVATCWDADRLDIGRVGIVRDPTYFFSQEAIDIVVNCDDRPLHGFSKKG